MSEEKEVCEIPIKFIIEKTGNDHIDKLIKQKFLFVCRNVWNKAMKFHFTPTEITISPLLNETGQLYAINLKASNGLVETEVLYNLIETFMQI